MRKLSYSAMLFLPVLLLFAGCGPSSWTARIVDDHWKPISEARVCVWSYPMNPNHPRKDAEDLEKAWKAGTEPMHGLIFSSDKNGVVRCKGIPTGGEAVDSYSPGHLSWRPGGDIIIRGRHDWDADERVRIILRERNHIVWTPPRYHEHWRRGDWLAITVTADGYRPTTFAFRPDQPSGDLGMIQLQPK